MMCPSCGYDNPPGQLVCRKCEYPLPPTYDGENSWDILPIEPDPLQPKARPVRRLRFWVEIVALGLLLGVVGWLAFLWWRQPERLNQYADLALGKGKQIVQSVGGISPGELIDRIMGRERVPTTVPEPPTATPVAVTAPADTPTPEPQPTDTPVPQPTEEPEPSPSPTVSAPEPIVPYVEIKAESLVNVRGGPSTDFDVVGTLGGGARADVTGMLEDGQWCRIDYEGEPAWIACYLDVITLYHGEEVAIVEE